MRYCVACVGLCLSLLSFAQTDKLFLKNGSRITGTIRNTERSDTIALQISGAQITIPLDLIAEIRPHRKSTFGDKYQAFGYRRGISAGIVPGMVAGKHGKNDSGTLRPSLGLNGLYHYHPLINVGVSASIFAYENFNIYPVCLEYELVLGRSRRGWMVYGSIGKSFVQPMTYDDTDLEAQGGIFYQTGLAWQHTARNTVQFRIGYAVATIEQRRELNPSQTFIQSRRINRITAQIGFVIHDWKKVNRQ